MAKNYNHWVDFQKFALFIKENKIVFILLILFLLTFKIECGYKEQKMEWNLSCVPLRISEVKELVK
jgi:hypothetical protein